MKHSCFFIFFCFFVFPMYAQDTLFLSAENSIIKYQMSHPTIKWEGINKEISGAAVKDSASDALIFVSITAPVAGFKSDNNTRDNHMQDKTEAQKYPDVLFESLAINSDSTILQVKGNLTFHNVTREVNFVVEPQVLDNKTIYTGSLDLLLTDFGIKPPRLMMIPADNNFTIVFSVAFPDIPSVALSDNP